MNSLALTCIVLALAAPAPKEGGSKEASPLVGVWACSSYAFGGMGLGHEELAFEFTADGKLLSRRAGKALSGASKYSSDPSKKPGAVDWTISDSGATVVGIFKIEKDVLTLCFLDSKEGKRPTEFASPIETRVSLMVFRRVEKKID